MIGSQSPNPRKGRGRTEPKSSAKSDPLKTSPSLSSCPYLIPYTLFFNRMPSCCNACPSPEDRQGQDACASLQHDACRRAASLRRQPEPGQKIQRSRLFSWAKCSCFFPTLNTPKSHKPTPIPKTPRPQDPKTNPRCLQIQVPSKAPTKPRSWRDQDGASCRDYAASISQGCIVCSDGAPANTCMHACTLTYIYTISISISVPISISISVSISISIYTHAYMCPHIKYRGMYECMSVYMYVCFFSCLFVCLLVCLLLFVLCLCFGCFCCLLHIRSIVRVQMQAR